MLLMGSQQKIMLKIGALGQNVLNILTCICHINDVRSRRWRMSGISDLCDVAGGKVFIRSTNQRRPISIQTNPPDCHQNIKRSGIYSLFSHSVASSFDIDSFLHQHGWIRATPTSKARDRCASTHDGTALANLPCTYRKPSTCNQCLSRPKQLRCVRKGKSVLFLNKGRVRMLPDAERS
jgi:hypothetical protein